MKYLCKMDDYFNYNVDRPLEENYTPEQYEKVLEAEDYCLKLGDKTFTTDGSIIYLDLELKFIESYNGKISLSIQSASNIFYDYYILYEVHHSSLKVLSISKDFHIVSDKIKEGKTYYVEALYKQCENYYIIRSVSAFTKCKLTKVKHKGDEVTVCIPVYNGEIFLPRTLDTILSGKFDKFRIVIVNDGSKDNTKDVLDWYSKKYPFIKAINNENRGVTYTRNECLYHANTPYMAFIDADDMISYNMLQRLYDVIVETDSDVSLCKSIVRDDLDTDSLVLNVQCDNYKLYSYEDMARESSHCSWDNIYFVALWNKIVRTSVAKKVRFPVNKYYEDSAYTPAMYSFADKFVFVKDAAYVWDKRKRITYGTYTNVYFEKDFYDTIRYFFDATVYPIYNGNRNNIEFVKYQAIKDLINYVDEIKGCKPDVKRTYRNKFRQLLLSTNIKNNRYFNEDKEIYNKVINYIYGRI